ncbi:hypothetical protein NMG60_11002990 [Bertholletia excelsa]
MTEETTAKVRAGRRNSPEIHACLDRPESPDLMIFGFLEDVEESSESSCQSGLSFDCGEKVEEEDEEDEKSCSVEEAETFWKSQEEVLRATLRRTSSIESKIREATMDALRELNSENIGCTCRRRVANGCRDCRRREVSDRLRKAGYNCASCKSKWKRSPDMPSGEHSYLEVTHSSKKGEVIRVLIELNFRAEFEMVKAGEEYNRLIHQLPEVFIGKGHRLRTLIKILCSAAKKCMKDKKMHMGPWRKQQYMQAKWLGKSEEETTTAPILPIKHLDRPPKQRASMLTFDLMESLPSLHCTAAIKVV